MSDTAVIRSISIFKTSLVVLYTAILTSVIWLVIIRATDTPPRNSHNTEVTAPDGKHWTHVHSDVDITIRTAKEGESIHSFLSFDVENKVIIKKFKYNPVIAWSQDGFTHIISYGATSSGCTLIRIDNAQKKVVYVRNLLGLGPVNHSQYGNKVTVWENASLGLVMILGNESYGQYREARDLNTGALITVSNEYYDIFDQSYPIDVK